MATRLDVAVSMQLVNSRPYLLTLRMSSSICGRIRTTTVCHTTSQQWPGGGVKTKYTCVRTRTGARHAPLTRERSTSASPAPFLTGVQTPESAGLARVHGRCRTRDRVSLPSRRSRPPRARDMLRRRCPSPAARLLLAGRLRLRPARAGCVPRIVTHASMRVCQGGGGTCGVVWEQDKRPYGQVAGSHRESTSARRRFNSVLRFCRLICASSVVAACVSVSARSVDHKGLTASGGAFDA